MQPLSGITPSAPVEAPFISSGLNHFPLKMKNGGRVFPRAFTHPMRVVAVDLGDTLACVLLFGGAITFGGLCSGCNPVPSMLHI